MQTSTAVAKSSSTSGASAKAIATACSDALCHNKIATFVHTTLSDGLNVYFHTEMKWRQLCRDHQSQSSTQPSKALRHDAVLEA